MILESQPRRELSGYELAQCVRRLLKGGFTLDQIAAKTCHSRQWVAMHLNMLDDLDARLKTMTSLELWRWLMTPALPLKTLLDSSTSSAEFRSTVENLDAPIRDASKSGRPAI